MCEGSNQGIMFGNGGGDFNRQLYEAAVSLARQIGNGDLDRFDAVKAAAKQQLSSHIAAGDISQKEVEDLLAKNGAAA